MEEEKKEDSFSHESEYLQETEFVHLGRKLAKIKPTDWDYDFDVDKVFKIDPYNIAGEIITIPVFVNRIGVIVAEMRTYTKKLKLKLEIKEAEIAKIFRNKKVGDTTKKPTIAEVDEYVMLDPVIRNLKFKLIRSEEDLEKLESMYNSAKDKSYKLNNLSKNLVPEQFENELLEGVVNGVLITLKEKKFKH